MGLLWRHLQASSPFSLGQCDCLMIVDQRIPRKDHPMKIERTNWRWRVPLRHRVEDCRWLVWRWVLAFQRPHAPRDAEAAYWRATGLRGRIQQQQPNVRRTKPNTHRWRCKP